MRKAEPLSRLSPGRRSRSVPDLQGIGEVAQEKGGLIALIALLALIFLATVPDAGLHRGLFSLFAQSFSRMKAPAGGLISLFSHKVHSFFAKPRTVRPLLADQIKVGLQSLPGSNHGKEKAT